MGEASLDSLILIFLDIDGVLLPFRTSSRTNRGDNDESHKRMQSTCGAVFPDYTLQSLSSIVEAFTPPSYQIKFVLSSTWRMQQSLIQQILDSFRLFGYAYGSPLAKVTEFYDITNLGLHYERQYEIDQWLMQNDRANVIAWLALDDEELLEGKVNAKRRSKFVGHVIQTDSHIGFTQSDANIAIQLIQNQINTNALK